MYDSQIQDERRHLLWSPVRLIAGFAIGILLAGLFFVPVWLYWFPNGIDSTLLALPVYLAVLLVAGTLGAALYAVKPIRRLWPLTGLVFCFACFGIIAGLQYAPALDEACRHGSAPQEHWCDSPSHTLMILAHAGAASSVGLFLGLVALRYSSQSQNSRD